MFEFDLAKRLYKTKKGEKKISKPAVIIAVLGIAIGLIVMILTLAIIIGFKSNIREKITGFTSDVIVTNYNAVSSFESHPIATTTALMNQLGEEEGVDHVQRYATRMGMIKTDNAFEGIVLKGVGQEYDTRFFSESLVTGRLPHFSDSISSNEVILSKSLADMMHLKLGDKPFIYFTGNKSIKARRLTIVGIYQTNYYEYDKLYLITDLHLLNRLNKWEKDQASGLELRLKKGENLERVTYYLSDKYSGKVDRYEEPYIVLNVEQLNGPLFGWLDLLDMNIWVILILMMLISGFTIISGLLIIILERTQMIGLLKGLGATNTFIRRIFIYLASFLIVKGLIIGNIVGLSLCFIQYKFGVIKLDPMIYYIDRVPISVSLWWVLLLNIVVMIIAILMLIGPSFIISKINPSTSMRYE